MRPVRSGRRCLLVIAAVLPFASPALAESWLQFKYDAHRSGNVPEREVTTPLGLVAAVPLTDAVLTAPVSADGRIYIVDASGTAFSIDAQTGNVVWQTSTPGGAVNCNNVSSPAVIEHFLHFGTTAGSYIVLEPGTARSCVRFGAASRSSAPVVDGGRVYFATLGSQVYAVEPNGRVCWTWDFAREVMKFQGDRWDGSRMARPQGRAGQLAGFVLLLDRYRGPRADDRHSGGRADRLAGRPGRSSGTPRRWVLCLLTPATSIRRRSARASARTAPSIGNGTAATTRAASRSSGSRGTRWRPISSAARKPPSICRGC